MNPIIITTMPIKLRRARRRCHRQGAVDDLLAHAKGESYERLRASDSLPPPADIAREIRSVLEQFESVAGKLARED